PVERVESTVCDGGEFLFTSEKVSRLRIEQLALASVGGVFDADEDRDAGTTSFSENVSCFLPAKLTSSPGVTSGVVDVDARVLACEGEADAVGGVAVDPSAVGDEGDDAFVSDAVGGPSECAAVGVVEDVRIRRGSEFGVGVG